MSRIATFADAHKVLQQYLPERVPRAAYTLDHITQLMDYLGNPQDKIRVLHVAGTSGKTSTAYYLAALLKAAGKKVGLSVSPHVDEINERIQIDMVPLPEKEYCAELEKFIGLVKESGVKPTYFELLVAFAYWQFARRQLDFAVIEVGLGGLLDGTNVVARTDKICVITDIGLDHQRVLGDTEAEIAGQKAGIIQLHNSVFTHHQSADVLEPIKQRAIQKQADLHIIDAKTPKAAGGLPLFQRHNFALALQAARHALRDDKETLSPDAVAKAAATYIPARMEIIRYKDKTIILDGAHNAQKLHALSASVRERFPRDDVAVLVSFVTRRGDRVELGARELADITKHLIVTTFGDQEEGSPRSEDLDIMTAICRTHGFWDITEEPNPEQAFELLLARPEPLLLVTGSFFLLNHIRPLLRKLDKV